MSSDTVIQVGSLGKRYRIRHRQEGGMRYKALRDVLADAGKSVLSRPWSLARRLWSAVRGPVVSGPVVGGPSCEDFWALKDVSFEVNQGDVVGIIGRNGAGKSTLLKILSRITEPTEGRVRIKGRVASLLEVGTGFHPELTGRENIFLNGAILGMHRTEIRQKFDEIVAFAEVEKFLDTPVKRYSSGMYIRLAFAVAAHLEPEILIVDEVLAVGDAEFQKKCLGKMQEVSTGGRTVLFVSHNMAAIETLCSSAFVLNRGNLLFQGEVRKSLAFYQSLQTDAFTVVSERTDRTGSGAARCVDVLLLDANGQSQNIIKSGDAFAVVFEVKSKGTINRVLPGLNITNALGQRVATFWGGFTDSEVTLEPGRNRLLLRVNRLDLLPGDYTLSALLGLDGETIDVVEDVLQMSVVAPAKWSPARFPTLDHGPLFTEFEWSKYD
ncbi:MAG TPA: ABC transporter ATP-binding protein [Candidatus Acidoferrum sp.]|jgi:lipopolysaccharide transport system ATP-binding protein|nr:ABC transporter ATP-binding protein [Candidatus Acidoferrum sp.]